MPLSNWTNQDRNRANIGLYDKGKANPPGNLGQHNVLFGIRRKNA